MGSNILCRIVDIGNVRIMKFNGIIRTLDAVRHVPELKINLISLSTFSLKGYKYIDEGRVLEVSKGVHIVIKGQRRS